MGCKLSSFGFSLTVQDIYEKVRASLSRESDGSCVKAATDDCVIFIKATRGEEARLYEKVKEITELIAVEAEKVGLCFLNDKAQLLLPKDWVPGDADIPLGIEVRSNTFESMKLQGMEIVGSPVGSLDYCRAFVERHWRLCYVKVNL